MRNAVKFYGDFMPRIEDGSDDVWVTFPLANVLYVIEAVAEPVATLFVSDGSQFQFSIEKANYRSCAKNPNAVDNWRTLGSMLDRT